jgi:hypothetical protein
MSAEIIKFGHPKGNPTMASQKSVQSNTGDGGTPAGDPIFAAIEKHRIAVQAIEDGPDDVPDELSRHFYCCKVDLATTKPTTLAGVIAILRYSREFSPSDFLSGEVNSESDLRCELPAWLGVIEQSLREIAAKRGV